MKHAGVHFGISFRFNLVFLLFVFSKAILIDKLDENDVVHLSLHLQIFSRSLSSSAPSVVTRYSRVSVCMHVKKENYIKLNTNPGVKISKTSSLFTMIANFLILNGAFLGNLYLGSFV